MRFRKKPVVIEAVQFTGQSVDGVNVIVAGLNHPRLVAGTPLWGEIQTLEGVMRADIGDWIITGVKGERYPCKPDIFAATYDAVDVPS